eukprot:CAMPEP_0114556768 /NCGR_PEP_ID=MMETSP0114-20121206/9464_1 /TAXON_ID=31324 /ORGANISM="Goniomonas sp, Strain m" /LENGTH=90 /DNA_ID=CAMNT_0001741993 /DNA_START=534 /DNA_END=803 /DNA_ORIENTATION=+
MSSPPRSRSLSEGRGSSPPFQGVILWYEGRPPDGYAGTLESAVSNGTLVAGAPAGAVAGKGVAAGLVWVDPPTTEPTARTKRKPLTLCIN